MGHMSVHSTNILQSPKNPIPVAHTLADDAEGLALRCFTLSETSDGPSVL